MKILILLKRPLFPADTGGKIRTLNLLRHMAAWHELTCLCNVQSGEEPYLDEMRKLGMRVETIPWRETPRGSYRFYSELALNLFSKYPFNVDKDFDPKLRSRAAELLSAEHYDLLICDFVQMARNAGGLNKQACLLFEHNVETQIFKRHAETDSGLLRRLYMRQQWQKMKTFEAEAGRQFESVVAVSHHDRNMFIEDYGWKHVEVIDTAVDLDYFVPSSHSEISGRCAFVGSMDWLPNEDGIRYFADRIWPAIRHAVPEATFQIIGRNPPHAIRRLEGLTGVEVTGTVPDIRPHLSEAAVVVVPLRIGGGTRLKIFEAMAMQKPVVSTSLGSEGLDLKSGEHLLIADDPSSFAEAVIGLLDDADRRRSLAEKARQLVVENYSSESVARQFDEICRRTVEAADNQFEEAASRP